MQNSGHGCTPDDLPIGLSGAQGVRFDPFAAKEWRRSQVKELAKERRESSRRFPTAEPALFLGHSSRST